MRGFVYSLSLLPALISAFSENAKDNVVMYWGQNSGLTEKPLGEYCKSDAADIYIVSFVNNFGMGGSVSMNLASCWNTFPGSNVLDCPKVGEDIKLCQKLGKKIILSLGGEIGNYGLQSPAEAVSVADELWSMFGAGSSPTRPFGDAVVDGYDLDLENKKPEHYDVLVKRLREHFAQDSSRKYYVAAAPQCVYPDASSGLALASADIDYVFIQFYNNPPCAASGSGFNWNTWKNFAETQAPNKNIKLFVGVPGSTSAAGSGYMLPSDLAKVIKPIMNDPVFGGLMAWDASQAFSNVVDGKPYVQWMKDTVKNAEPEPPKSSAPVPKPSKSSEAVPESSKSSAPVPVPSTSSEVVPVPSTSSEVVPVPSTSSEVVPVPSKSSEAVPVPSKSSEVVPVPSKSSEVVPIPSKSSEAVPKPSESSDPGVKPSSSSKPQPGSSKSSEHAPKSSRSSKTKPSQSSTPSEPKEPSEPEVPPSPPSSATPEPGHPVDPAVFSSELPHKVSSSRSTKPPSTGVPSPGPEIIGQSASQSLNSALYPLRNSTAYRPHSVPPQAEAPAPSEAFSTEIIVKTITKTIHLAKTTFLAVETRTITQVITPMPTPSKADSSSNAHSQAQPAESNEIPDEAPQARLAVPPSPQDHEDNPDTAHTTTITVDARSASVVCPAAPSAVTIFRTVTVSPEQGKTTEDTSIVTVTRTKTVERGALATPSVETSPVPASLKPEEIRPQTYTITRTITDRARATVYTLVTTFTRTVHNHPTPPARTTDTHPSITFPYSSMNITRASNSTALATQNARNQTKLHMSSSRS